MPRMFFSLVLALAAYALTLAPATATPDNPHRQHNHAASSTPTLQATASPTLTLSPSPTATSTSTTTRTPTPTGTPSATATTTPTATATAAASCSSTLQQLIDAAPAGATLTLPACIFRETANITKPLTIDGQHHAEVRGSDVWSAWTSSSSGWTSQNTYPNVGDDSTAGSAPCDQGGPCYVDRFRAFNLEQVFLDGQPLTHVPSNPTAGQFELDAARHVLLADNPIGRILEVSTRKRWFNTQADNVHLLNLGMHHAATGAFESSLSSDLHPGFVLSGSTLTDAHGSMLGVGGQGENGAQITGNTLARAGDVALGGYQGTGELVEGNTFTDNGGGGWEPNWQAGALKLVALTNGTIDSNTVTSGFGMGLWCDIHCSNVTISNNHVHDVTDVGIHFEISNGCHIFGNSVWNVGARQHAPSIYLANSGDCEVDHNTVAHAQGNALFMYDANRADTGTVENNYFHDNTVVMDADAGYKALGFEDYTGGSLLNTGEHGAADAFWYPVPEGSAGRYSYGSLTPNLSTFNTTPGGGGNSRYLSDAEKSQALAAAGIP